MRDIVLSCHYCRQPLSLTTVRVLDAPVPTGDGGQRSVPAAHCPTCATVVECLLALGASLGRGQPTGA